MENPPKVPDSIPSSTAPLKATWKSLGEAIAANRSSGPVLTPADLARLTPAELKSVAQSYGVAYRPWAKDRPTVEQQICAAAALAAAPDPASEFATLASALSDRLGALEKSLGSRPGTVKAEVSFETEERSHRLQWSRHAGVWRFWVYDIPTREEVEEARDDSEGGTLVAINGRFLTQCSVDVKLAAAEVVPTLLAAVKAGELKTIERLKAAHAKLNALAQSWPEGA